MNHRLSLSRIALQRYEISLFGNLIKALESDTYFYLDSGYLYLLLGYGLVVFLVIMSAYMIVFRYALKSNDKKLFIWCIIVSVFSFVNNIIVDVNINPLLFGVWSGISVHRQWRSHVLGNMLSENELRGKSCEEESII